MRGFRTDLAMESVGEESGRLEGVSMSAHQIGGVKRTRIVIQSRRAAEVLQRPVGEYITLECPELSRCGQPGLKLTPSFTRKIWMGKIGVSPLPRPASVASITLRITMRPSGEVSMP